MLRHTTNIARGRSKVMVQAVSLGLIGLLAYPVYDASTGEIGQGVRASFRRWRSATGGETHPPPTSLTAETWLGRKLVRRDQSPYGAGTRLDLLYEDGTQVRYQSRLGGPVATEIAVIDPSSRAVRAMSLDRQGRTTAFRLTTFDETMGRMQREEYADAAAFADGHLRYSLVRLFDGHGRDLNDPVPGHPTGEFRRAISTSGEDLKFFIETER